MHKIKLLIAYKGTAYGGWQIQPNAPTIQEEIVDAIKKITGEDVNLQGSGRTDAGVHAAGQVAHFTTESNIPADRFALALNTKLPSDIRVLKSERAKEDFHSRYSAIGKQYCYRIYHNEIASPFYSDYTWHIKYPIDIDLMEHASSAFLGEHDYKGFMSTGSAVKTTIRRIDSIKINKQGPIIEIFFEGNGFLYNMVRIMVGTLVMIASGRIKCDELPDIINSGEREQAGITAPASGLMLMKVFYNL